MHLASRASIRKLSEIEEKFACFLPCSSTGGLEIHIHRCPIPTEVPKMGYVYMVQATQESQQHGPVRKKREQCFSKPLIPRGKRHG